MTHHATPITLREILLQVLLLVVLTVLLVPRTYFRGEVIAPGELLLGISPWRAHAPEDADLGRHGLLADSLKAMNMYYAVAERSLDKGQWPLWNTYEYAGMPLMANYQSCVFYPPRLLHGVFGLFVASSLYILLKLLLCGLTAYVCGRVIGLAKGPSRFLSIAWMLSIYNLLYAYWPLPDVAAWVPVVFLGAELTLAGRYRQGFFAEALGAVLILLAGHPETAFVFSLGVGTYFVSRLLVERRWGKRLWMPVLAAGGAWAVALLVCAVQIVPFAEYMLHSYSYAKRAEAEVVPLDMTAPAAFWVPKFFGVWGAGTFWGKGNSNLTGMLYGGVVVWVGALALAIARAGRRATGDRDSVSVHAGALLLSVAPFVLAAFNAEPMDRLHKLPVLTAMHAYYFIAYPMFALPLLSAIGLHRFFSGRCRLRAWWPVLPALALVAGTVYWAWSFNAKLIKVMELSGYVRGQIALAAFFALAGLAVLGMARFAKRHRVLMALFTVLAAVDLVMAGRYQFATSPRDQLLFATRTTDFLLDRAAPCRVGASMCAIPRGILPLYGVEQWLGYDGIYPERVVRLQQTLGPGIWDKMEPFCSVQYYLHDTRLEPLFPRDEPGWFDLAFAAEGVEIHRNLRARPRAYLVGGVRLEEDPNQLFATMRGPDYDPAREVLTDWAPGEALALAPGAAQGTAEVVEHTPLRVTVDVETDAPGVLVLADAYYPGWKAYLGGARADIFPAYYAFRGVVVPEGESRVVFRYEPLSAAVGLGVSAGALLAGAAVALLMIWRGRRRVHAAAGRHSR